METIQQQLHLAGGSQCANRLCCIAPPPLGNTVPRSTLEIVASLSDFYCSPGSGLCFSVAEGASLKAAADPEITPHHPSLSSESR